MKNNKLKELFNKPSMILVSLILEYFLSVLVLFTFAKIIDLKNCFGIVQTLSFAIPIIIYLFVNKGDKKKNIVSLSIVMVLYAFIILVLPFVFGKTFDLTIDGNSYHKTAVGFLKNGWNPLYENSEDFQKHNGDVIKFGSKEKIKLWVNHYPKASWIIAANYYSYTNNIESGKCLSFILIICSGIIAYNVLEVIIKKKYAFIIAVLLALNPIALSQMFTFYVDGIMGSCFLMELLLLFTINPKEKMTFSSVLLLTSICSIFVNLKFTGLLYSGLIAAIFYFYWLIKNRKDKNIKGMFINLTRNFVIIFATAIFIVGSTSYVTNTINKHNPLFPLIGPGKEDIITEMQPKEFGEMNGIEKFFLSTFAKTENVNYSSENKVRVKIPFKVYDSEIESLQLPDTRMAGFGPLFAMSLCMASVLFVIGLVKLITNEKDKLKYVVISGITILASMILVGESWWARYIPQFYMFVIGSILLFIYTFKYFKFKKIFITYTLATALVIIINLGFFISTEINYLDTFKGIGSDLYELSNREEVLLTTGTPKQYGYYYNLKDRSINYKMINDITKVDEDKIRYMYSWRLEVVNDD